MSASSAWESAGHGNGTQNQFSLDGAAPSATPTSSSQPGNGTTKLAESLKLSIDLHIRPERQWLSLTLEDEMNLTRAEVNYPILCTTLNRAYHLREAVVIGMRRLMQEAFEEDLISDYPGELMTVWKQPQELAEPTLSTLLDESFPSLTDLGSL